ncbi:hypothetical protein BGM19_31990 [Streptomyces agglomeratus]|uniref:hypothetical protein n=1 Tax=Streptomyces agglomeratus TaxID=285458 RepID=UPI00086C3668|nr:hypothetical protein [Streptomyces agglomeratus]OEJ61956.1 hypothetical protein BGM19_31990 [Streptomyces agglomeratus]
MNTGLKITAFAAAVAATFGTAYGVGKGVGPVTTTEERSVGHGGHGEKKERDATGGGHGGHEAASAAGGLQVSEGGYTLALETPRVAAGGRTKLRFSIQDEHGRKVTAYEREHGKELHFIVASRDLTVYRHLHPTRAADGTWSTSADLPAAGAYRAFADFKPAKKGAGALTLGADLAVSGTYAPAGLPAPAATAEVDGYEVALSGGLRPGKAGELRLNVEKNGEPVTDLQPYLGAYGHLVALRSGDLAYLHVHPNGEPGDSATEPGPEISFTATAPSSGTYRLFLDFQHDGKVRTAAFTVEAGRSPAAGPAADEHQEEKPGHAH